MKIFLLITMMCSAMMAEGKISGVGFFDYTYDLTEEASGADKSSFAFNRI